mmetsp:Transcript_33986/g.95574  ORF Transcript_33986/g.95574 Transcript_33986/m.95574 type:complete len:330 (-) Transcript_33986:211-1200(-)
MLANNLDAGLEAACQSARADPRRPRPRLGRRGAEPRAGAGARLAGAPGRQDPRVEGCGIRRQALAACGTDPTQRPRVRDAGHGLGRDGACGGLPRPPGRRGLRPGRREGWHGLRHEGRIGGAPRRQAVCHGLRRAGPLGVAARGRGLAQRQGVRARSRQGERPGAAAHAAGVPGGRRGGGGGAVVEPRGDHVRAFRPPPGLRRGPPPGLVQPPRGGKADPGQGGRRQDQVQEPQGALRGSRRGFPVRRPPSQAHQECPVLGREHDGGKHGAVQLRRRERPAGQDGVLPEAGGGQRGAHVGRRGRHRDEMEGVRLPGLPERLAGCAALDP